MRALGETTYQLPKRHNLAEVQELLQSSTPDNERDSDSCNIGSPTAASVHSFRPFSPSSEDRISAADSTRCHRRARPAGHVVYRLCGSVEGFRRYLRMTGSLQLLLVCPAMVQKTALSAREAEPAGGVQPGSGWPPQHCPQQLASPADDVAVGCVAVSLHDLAAVGSAEGARYVWETWCCLWSRCSASVLLRWWRQIRHLARWHVKRRT